MNLTKEQENLARAIEKAAFHGGPMSYGGYDLRRVAADAEQVVEETFIPNRIDPSDAPIGTREEVQWWTSLDHAKQLLETRYKGRELT